MYPGDFAAVAYRKGGVVAFLIRTITRSRYSHAVLYIGDGQVVEANPAGVAIFPVSKYDGEQLLWSAASLTPAERDQIVGEGLKMIGYPYHFLDLVALAFSAWGITVPWVYDRLNRGDRVICSQLVVLAYRRAGLVLFPDKADCRVTPANLAQLILHEPVDPNR